MSDFKKVLLYAIIPAVIAGLFALIPKVYDEFSEPKAALVYSMTQGPGLEVDGQYKSIISIKVENSGKKILSNISAHIESLASFEAKNLTNSSGLEPKLLGSESIKVLVDKMHPEDHFTLSLMQSYKTPFAQAQISLRSDEVLGTINIQKKDNSKTISFFSSFLSGLSVFLMAIYFILKSKFAGALPGIGDKPHTLYYIAAKSQFKEITALFGTAEGNLTYLRFSDMLFYTANSDVSKKEPAICALKSMLLIREISKSSVNQILRHLKVLEGDLFQQIEVNDLRERSKVIKNSLDLRNEIDIVVD